MAWQSPAWKFAALAAVRQAAVGSLYPWQACLIRSQSRAGAGARVWAADALSATQSFCSLRPEEVAFAVSDVEFSMVLASYSEQEQVLLCGLHSLQG